MRLLFFDFRILCFYQNPLLIILNEKGAFVQQIKLVVLEQ